jgi:hypothetical protein
MVATRDIQPTNFVVNNEVKYLDKQVWLVELLLGDKPGREYCFHLSIVDDRTV